MFLILTCYNLCSTLIFLVLRSRPCLCLELEEKTSWSLMMASLLKRERLCQGTADLQRGCLPQQVAGRRRQESPTPFDKLLSTALSTTSQLQNEYTLKESPGGDGVGWWESGNLDRRKKGRGTAGPAQEGAEAASPADTTHVLMTQGQSSPQ